MRNKYVGNGALMINPESGEAGDQMDLVAPFIVVSKPNPEMVRPRCPTSSRSEKIAMLLLCLFKLSDETPMRTCDHLTRNPDHPYHLTPHPCRVTTRSGSTHQPAKEKENEVGEVLNSCRIAGSLMLVLRD